MRPLDAIHVRHDCPGDNEAMMLRYPLAVPSLVHNHKTADHMRWMRLVRSDGHRRAMCLLDKVGRVNCGMLMVKRRALRSERHLTGRLYTCACAVQRHRCTGTRRMESAWRMANTECIVAQAKAERRRRGSTQGWGSVDAVREAT